MECSIWDYSLLIWFIFIFPGLTIIGLGYIFYQRKKDKKTDYLKSLVEYVNDEYMTFQDEHENYSEAKALRVFFNNSRIYLKALELQREDEKNRKEYDDEVKKNNIKNRVFAYDYEETIYEIFSKTAYIFTPQHPTEKIVYHYSDIKKDVFIEELSSKLKLSKDEAESLFNVFLNRQLVFMNRNGACRIGFTLKLYWNVVSSNDLNFSRWMEAHPEIKAKLKKVDMDELSKKAEITSHKNTIVDSENKI